MRGQTVGVPNGKRKVLVIDDEESFRLVLREVLNELGFESIEAADATQGLSVFKREHPSSVLLDIYLPDRSGFDVLREIKSMTPETNVIITTGEDIEENALQAIRNGADEFIGKPIHPHELKYLLEKHSSPPQIDQTRGKLKLLIVSDAAGGMADFTGFIKGDDVHITCVSDAAELPAALELPHDIAVIDVASINIMFILESLRMSPLHSRIPVLVDVSRLDFSGDLAGIMPTYRAMPCSPQELRALTRRRIASLSEKIRSRPLL